MKRKQPRKAPRHNPHPPPEPGLGERLKNARLNAGFETQRPFADSLGVSYGLVAFWETDRKKPSPGRLHQIAAVTRTSMEELWQGKAPTKTKHFLRPDEVQVLRLYERLPTHARKNAIDMFDGYVRSIIIEGRKATARVRASIPP